MIGLGKMGGFMVERLVRGVHKGIGLDRDATAGPRGREGAAGTDSIAVRRTRNRFVNTLLAMMRHKFGGHALKTAK